MQGSLLESLGDEMKKILNILLTFLLCSALLIGCGAADSDDPGSKYTAGTERTKITESETKAEPSDASSPGALKKAEKETTAAVTAESASAKTHEKGTEKTPSKKLDQYQTAPVPDGKPSPVEPQKAEVNKKKTLHCTLSVSCASIFDHLDRFDQAKLEVLPKDGIIYKAKKIAFYEGESVFDVLLRETRENKIHMEFVDTPIYNSNYIEGINNIYEFDCGELSGWMYQVNDWFPNYGCSRYQLQDGDRIEWVYTCDLGRDVGNEGNLQRGEEGQGDKQKIEAGKDDNQKGETSQ